MSNFTSQQLSPRTRDTTPPDASPRELLGRASVTVEIGMALGAGETALVEFEGLRDAIDAWLPGLRVLADSGWSQWDWNDGFRHHDLQIWGFMYERGQISEREALEHLHLAEVACQGTIDFVDFGFFAY